MPRANHRRIHELEYELGYREDPPPLAGTDEPGAIHYYRGNDSRRIAQVAARNVGIEPDVFWAMVETEKN